MNDNLSDLPSLYTLTGDVKDINTLLISREAVRLNAQGGSVTPQLAVSPSLLSDIRELAAYAEGSKSPRMARASRSVSAWLEGAQPAEPVNAPHATTYCQHPHCQNTCGCQGPCSKKQAEPMKAPDWSHPKIQALIGSDARKCIQIDLIWQILEDPNQECTASDMEYWDTIHDKLKEALSTKPAAPQPAQQPVDEREAFEAWAVRSGYASLASSRSMWWVNNVSATSAWLAWQARAALSAQAQPAQSAPEISTKHGPWVESTLHEGETYCKRCLTRSIFAGDRECDPHIVEAPAAPQPAQGVPDGMVLVNRGVLNMVINALRRDAEEGRQVRGEMADLLSESQQPSSG